jgi:hypothetical protein
MPPQCSRDLFGYEVVEGRQVVAAFDGGEVTSDAGGLLLGATDRAIGLVSRFAACFDDGRARRLAPKGDLGGRPGAPTRSSTASMPWWRSGCSASRSAMRI